MHRRKHLSSFIFIIAITISGCSNKAIEKYSWKEQLNSQIELLGHRNWIVVADAAYPLQSNKGISTILSNTDHLTTIQTVDAIIKKQKHVKSVMYLDKEIDFVSEEDAAGIEMFRTEIEKMGGTGTNKELHEDIIKKLDEASELFNVIIIKTDFTIPYTTVFFQLDCKYWNAEAESILRTKMSESEK